KIVLEQLRFSKKSQNSALSSSNSQSTTSTNHHSHSNFPIPPPQVRDATMSSRFFTPSSSSLGKILVPNSSPLSGEDDLSHPQSTFHTSTISDVASPPQSFVSNTSVKSPPTLGYDPMTAPTNFWSRNPSSSNLRRARVSDATSQSYDEPPRKKINMGTTVDDVRTESPEIRRVGQQRRISRASADEMSTSSDDYLPDLSSNSGSHSVRLRRTRQSPAPQPQPASEQPVDQKFIAFKMTHPLEPPSRTMAAWNQAGGDVNRATALLVDSSWSPQNSFGGEKEGVGRVKEIDEASKALREATKAKGKLSMIYANRSNLEVQQSTPTSSHSTHLNQRSIASPLSPTTPLFKPSRTKTKKLVIQSDSEDDDESLNDSLPAVVEDVHELKALDYFNASSREALRELTGCTADQARYIEDIRPFESVEQLRERLGQGKRRSGPHGISKRMFDDCVNILKGYGSVDRVLQECEEIGQKIRSVVSSWSSDQVGDDIGEDGSLSLLALPSDTRKPKDCLTSQPKLLSDTVSLKEYQLLGVNWLNLLYRKKLSCILADEMGLGKTVQVISFLAALKEQGVRGPHLVVVPSSTLENWCREFARFAPSIAVQTYYADKNERPALRQTLLDTQLSQNRKGEGWEVLITTYNLAQGDDKDRKFFRRIDWDCCIYDEGHVLKNFQSQRYQSLLKYGSNWRLLLTGTPLQNNLQELVSLLNFILPDKFAGSIESLRTIFKVKGDTTTNLLSQERISRAKKMMTPFVLRRRKDQVLKELPVKTERIEWCDMTELQSSLYRTALQRSRKTILEVTGDDNPDSDAGKTKKSTKGRSKDNKTYTENSSNVLMDLRKAASHPMLFRTRFSDDILSKITHQLLKEPDFKKRGALFDIVKEDMSVMTDAELQSTRKFLQDEGCYIDAGKVQVLLKLLEEYDRQQRKVLIFSQFTQVLDILQAIFNINKRKFLVLTGSTPVDVRQTLVDEFTEDQSIPIFLLSTKAGGMGINLTAASVVIMFDQDFNPHNDRQAQDRAYRIGQKRDVEVVKLISKGTIEEDILKLGQTKLALDEAVAGDADERGEGESERVVKTSLMNVLRQQLEKEQVV
ncbi:hypothetical protein CVT24_009408, partial [Panaeolus cyanescens]